MTPPKPRLIEVESHKRSKAEIAFLQHSQRHRLRSLEIALRKWLEQLLASPKRPRRDRRIKRLYFGWFGGVQCFYSRESEP